MVVAGLFLKANECRVVTLTGTRTEHQLLAPKFNKLALVKNPTQADVTEFIQIFKAYCLEHQVEQVVINRRATSGQGAGGAGTFLIEGVLLAVSPVAVELIHPATIRATDKRSGTNKSVKPKTVDLGKAYDLAYELLPE